MIIFDAIINNYHGQFNKTHQTVSVFRVLISKGLGPKKGLILLEITSSG